MGLGLTYKPLKEITTKIGSGATPKGGGESYKEIGISLIRSQNILDFEFSYNGLAFIDEEQAQKLKNVTVEENDILLNITGDSVARCSIVPSQVLPARVNQHVMIIRVDNEKASYKYVFYYLQYLKRYLLQLASGGATRKALTKTMIENLEINLISLKEQEEIANILSSFDEKIENNNAIIANLEEQAQAIFKSWFIDFEPFQNEEFVDSELGKVPKDWTVEKLGNVVNLFDSKRIPLSQMNRQNMEKNYPYYGANGVIDYVESYIFNGKYLLLGEDGTVQTDEGFPILNFINEKFWVSNHAHIMIGKKISTEFLYSSLKRRNIKNIITGAVQQKINQRNLKSIQLVIPTENILNEFQNLIEPMFKQILLLKNYNKKLEEIRNTLLPKLMSGEIRVGDVELEKVVETKI